MARINLLPWREELRRERQRQFMLSTVMTAVLGVVLVFMIGLVFDQKIRHQEERNQVIQTEINKLQIRIKRINQLEQTRDRLISRKRIIKELQASRSQTVELLDKLAKTIPVGVTQCPGFRLSPKPGCGWTFQGSAIALCACSRT
jgi:type IV pilus assembly protein PilN